MKRWKKVLLGFFGLVAMVVLGLIGYISMRWNHKFSDIKGPSDLHASTDPKVIEHGKYLVRGPAHCSNCHQGNFDEYVRADKGEELPLRGGVEFAMGPIGILYPRNLTPCKETGIGRYDDQTVFRMMRTSVKPDGTISMSPLMPFHHMADDDLVAVLSYLRAQAPVKNDIPQPKYTFLGKAIRTFAPIFKPIQSDAPKVAPAEGPTKERGEYLARYVANCVGCHTKADLGTGRYVGPEFAGGFEFEPPPAGAMGSDGKTWFRSPNLTSDAETGILQRFPNKEEWIKRFRQGRVLPGSPMHWGPFSRMTDSDLEAIWVFLKTLPPIKYEVGTTAYIKQS
jgi:mono/diheme cytochrome c family protein